MQSSLATSLSCLPEIEREAILGGYSAEELLGLKYRWEFWARPDQLNRTSAFRRAKSAIDRGYVINTEEKPNRPLKLILGDPLPVERVVLPPLPGDERNDATAPRGDVAGLHEVPGAERDTPADDPGEDLDFPF